MTYDIYCTDPTHPENSAYPGWDNGVLGESDQPPTGGYQCAGCAAAAQAREQAS